MSLFMIKISSHTLLFQELIIVFSIIRFGFIWIANNLAHILMQIMINTLAVVLKPLSVIFYHTITMNMLESTFIQTISSAVKRGDYANVD